MVVPRKEKGKIDWKEYNKQLVVRGSLFFKINMKRELQELEAKGGLLWRMREEGRIWPSGACAIHLKFAPDNMSDEP